MFIEEFKTPFKMRLQLFGFGNEDIDDSVDDNVDNEDIDSEEDGLEVDENLADDECEKNEDDTDLPDESAKQSKEQDRAFADLRRRAEQAERELQAREQWVRQMFSGYGVNSWQEYQQKMESQIRQQREQQLKQAGVDPRIIKEIIDNDPAFVQMKQQNEVLQQQMREQQEQQRLVGDYQELIGEFGEDFPELKDPNKIPKEVWEKYDRGYTLADAFSSVKRKEIRQMEKEKAKQSTLNKINGKKHTKVEGDGSKEGGDVNIPADVMEMYKEMGFDKKQAIAYHKKIYK